MQFVGVRNAGAPILRSARSGGSLQAPSSPCCSKPRVMETSPPYPPPERDLVRGNAAEDTSEPLTALTAGGRGCRPLRKMFCPLRATSKRTSQRGRAYHSPRPDRRAHTLAMAGLPRGGPRRSTMLRIPEGGS